ncbi:MAG: putative lipid II flippase FtsW [Patescibacteria group bacterium]|jgi:cell division protein FtsW
MPSYRKRNKRIDIILALVILALVGFGLVMISSTSVVLSYEKFGQNYYYLTKQFQWLLIGIIAMIVLTIVDYMSLRKYALWCLIITLLMLSLLLLPGVSNEIKGATRWVHIGPIFFQPSEFAKLGFLIYLAAWLDRKGILIKSFTAGFLPFFVLVAVFAFLIMKQPDMGTTLVFVITAVSMFFVAGADFVQFLLGGLGAAAAFLILIFSSSYRLSRLKVFWDHSSQNALGAGYHMYQALIAIGSGGLLGLGFGQSQQKYLYLPEPFSDSIFAITVEELGFLRSMFVILAFLFIAYRGYNIAKSAPDNFGKFLAIGITTWIVFQAFLNIGAMVGAIPLTGVPLPFISAGGSSLVVNLAAIGILLNISKHSSGA